MSCGITPTSIRTHNLDPDAVLGKVPGSHAGTKLSQDPTMLRPNSRARKATVWFNELLRQFTRSRGSSGRSGTKQDEMSEGSDLKKLGVIRDDNIIGGGGSTLATRTCGF